MFWSKILTTPLGSMIALANEKELYVLQFVDEGFLEQKMQVFTKQLQAKIVPKQNGIHDWVEEELQQYFAGALKNFTVPIDTHGSLFQKIVWNELQKIPFAVTKSYSEIACAIGKPGAHRAIGRANGANPLAIIIPCHRVIYVDSTIGGYSGGIARKQWLLHHENF